MKKGRYLITGCAGFIGSNLVNKIYKKYDLILVDDLSEGSVLNLPKELRKKLIKKKIQNIKKLKNKKIDGIFHLAAQSSASFSMRNFYKSSVNNIQSSLKVFELSKREINSFTEKAKYIMNNYKEIQKNMEQNVLPTKKSMIKQISDIIKIENS